MMKPTSVVTTLVVVLCCTMASVQAFYLPGVLPREFRDGEEVPLKVNSLTSALTQMPMEYYRHEFCPVEGGVVPFAENLGEILLGDRIENSPYVIEAGVAEECKKLCGVELSVEGAELFEKRIKKEYRVNWIIDNLPAVTRREMRNGENEILSVFEAGFPLGVVRDGVAYLNNHVHMKIHYHTSPDYPGRRIVQFEVEPRSIKYASSTIDKTSCSSTTGEFSVTGIMEPVEVVWTYSVEWIENTEVRWASRWDPLLQSNAGDSQIHWFSIVNSILIVLFLTGMLGMIMMRVLSADLRRYREMEMNDDAQEETGWKLVHGDVFRPPTQPLLLSVLVGSGMQVVAMFVITLLFALLGFLSPANRGGLMTAMVLLYILMGLFAGYLAARMFKSFKGANWKLCTICTALLFPGTCFSIFFFLNTLLWVEQSAGHVPFGIMLGLLSLWFGVSLPLTFFGGYLGNKKPADEFPVRTNQIPRQIPEHVWYQGPIVSILMGGVLPFGAVFIELYFILSSIWQHQFYYMFGFLFIVFVIMVITSAEITIVMTYFQLCAEDYHWWWRAFLTSGASAIYLYFYAVFYFFTKLHISDIVPALLYFGYSLIMSLAFFVLTGVIGFYSSYIFVLKIYSAVKVD